MEARERIRINSTVAMTTGHFSFSSRRMNGDDSRCTAPTAALTDCLLSIASLVNC